MRPFATLLSFLALCASGLAQQSETSPAQQKKLIYAAHMLDVKTGKTLDNVTIRIVGDKVASVETGEHAPAAGTNTIYLDNATVLPGLIDAHTHLTSDPVFGYQQLAISVPKEALVGAKNARLTLEAGFTTVRNVGDRG